MISDDLLERETTHHVIGAFFEVYKTLGFGFLEHVYREALERELIARGRIVQKEVAVPVWYKGEVISTQRVNSSSTTQSLSKSSRRRFYHRMLDDSF